MTKYRGKIHHWFGQDHSREKNGHWKGGSYINDAGYKMVYDPAHHRANSNGYVREHIVLAEKALGGPLPKHTQIHHINKRSDNSSIVICENQEYHQFLHMRQDALEASGNPNKRKCKYCKEYDTTDNLYCKQFKPHGWNIYHKSCARVYDRKRRLDRRHK